MEKFVVIVVLLVIISSSAVLSLAVHRKLKTRVGKIWSFFIALFSFAFSFSAITIGVLIAAAAIFGFQR